MAEYVERKTIMEFPIRKDRCDKEHANEHFIFGIESVLEYVENLPSADVTPVVHGRWIMHADELGLTCECSVCHIETMCDGNYCPNCGARMDIQDGGDKDAAD